MIYTRLEKFDSARYFFVKATPGFETKTTPASQIAFYSQYADLYSKPGDMPKAIEYYTKAKILADGMMSLEWQEGVAKELDSLYAKAGNYKQSRLYGNLYHTYKDSLQKLGEQKVLIIWQSIPARKKVH